MSTLKTPFRYDFVGSFLRPEKHNNRSSPLTSNLLSSLCDFNAARPYSRGS